MSDVKKLTKEEKKAAKKKAKEELKAAKKKAKEDAKAAKKQAKLDKKEAKKLGITYDEFVKRRDRKAELVATRAKNEAKKEEDEQRAANGEDGNGDSEGVDGDRDGDGGGKNSDGNYGEEDDEDEGSAVNLLDDVSLAGATPNAPSGGSSTGSSMPMTPTGPILEPEPVPLSKEEKRAKPLFGKKRTIAPSPTRQQKNNEKKLTDPLLSRRRKLIANHCTVVDLKASQRITQLEQIIFDYEQELKQAPRDPIIEPKHKRAYQERQRLLKDKPPAHWGRLNSVGDAITFYKIKLYLQRLTSLKLFPQKSECPFLEDERDSYDEKIEWRCIHLDCSVNSISKIKNIDHFVYLRCLDLSSNHITTIGTTLQALVDLRELNLANNAIVKIEGIDACPNLIKLNLHGNDIPKIENLTQNLGKLTHLDLGGNRLSRVEQLNRLPSLKALDLSRNDILSAEELAFVPQLESLKIGRNKLDNLVEFGRSLVGLSKLKELKVSGNPICDQRDYRLRVLENTSIQLLDDVVIKPRLRTYLKEMQRRSQLEDIMETTTQDYMDRIAAEREVKSDNMELLRRSQLELEGAFGKYRSEMENELQECISYIHSLDVREDLVERDILLTDRGMTEWKAKLQSAQLRRDVAKRSYVRKQQAALLQQTAHTSEALKYTEKLKELSDVRPGIWREMKRKELEQRTVEQDTQLQEDLGLAKDRKRYQKEMQDIREDRERAMLSAVDSIDPHVEAWWDPDAQTRDVTINHQHRHDAEHRSEIQRRGSSAIDGRAAKSDDDGGASSNGSSSDAISIRSDATSVNSVNSKSSKNSKNNRSKLLTQGIGIQKKKGTQLVHTDSNDDNSTKKTKIKSTSAKNRYRVKFGPGSMGIKLVDVPDEDETGVYVKGLVEGGKGAVNGKIKVGDLLVRIQDEDVEHMSINSVLAKIKASSRPIQLEFSRPEKIAAHIAASADVEGHLYSCLFEKGKIGVVWEEEIREEGGGAIVKEVREGSQAYKHTPSVKSGDVLVTVAGEDVTRLNIAAINKRIAKARRPVRFDFESGEGADLLAGAFGEEEDEDEDEDDNDEDQNKMKKPATAKKGLHDLHKKQKVDKKVKKVSRGWFGRSKKKKVNKVAPET
jgi:hypothetical protein